MLKLAFNPKNDLKDKDSKSISSTIHKFTEAIREDCHFNMLVNHPSIKILLSEDLDQNPEGVFEFVDMQDATNCETYDRQNRISTKLKVFILMLNPAEIASLIYHLKSFDTSELKTFEWEAFKRLGEEENYVFDYIAAAIRSVLKRALGLSFTIDRVFSIPVLPKEYESSLALHNITHKIANRFSLEPSTLKLPTLNDFERRMVNMNAHITHSSLQHPELLNWLTREEKTGDLNFELMYRLNDLNKSNSPNGELGMDLDLDMRYNAFMDEHAIALQTIRAKQIKKAKKKGKTVLEDRYAHSYTPVSVNPRKSYNQFSANYLDNGLDGVESVLNSGNFLENEDMPTTYPQAFLEFVNNYIKGTENELEFKSSKEMHNLERMSSKFEGSFCIKIEELAGNVFKCLPVTSEFNAQDVEDLKDKISGVMSAGNSFPAYNYLLYTKNGYSSPSVKKLIHHYDSAEALEDWKSTFSEVFLRLDTLFKHKLVVEFLTGNLFDLDAGVEEYVSHLLALTDFIKKPQTRIPEIFQKTALKVLEDLRDIKEFEQEAFETSLQNHFMRDLNLCEVGTQNDGATLGTVSDFAR